MSEEIINSEIIELEKICVEWVRTKMSKNNAQMLVGKMGVFLDTFSLRFPHGFEIYSKNPFIKVNFNDGIEELEYYAASNLKQKDNEYFSNGIRHVSYALNGIVRDLQKQ